MPIVSSPAYTPLPPFMQQDVVWAQMLQFQNSVYHFTCALTNELGPNFPALSDEVICRLLHIQPHERVLDIGGGDSCLQRANVVTDAFPDMDAHRSGRSLQSALSEDKEFVQCFAEELPFADKSFDVAYARAVFEHTIDPAAACREMMRVANRGFIETPSPLAEYLGGHPTHRWIVWVEPSAEGEPVLVFRRKPYRTAPFSYLLRGCWFTSNEFNFLWEWKYRNAIDTQLAWEGTFQFRVEEGEPEQYINYDDPAQAALAHLDTAVSSIQFGEVPAEVILPDLEYALKLQPEWALAHNALGCLYHGMQQTDKAKACFAEAVRLNPEEAAYRQNLQMNSAYGEAALLLIPQEQKGVSHTELQRCAITLRQLEQGLALLLPESIRNAHSPRMQEIMRRLNEVRASAGRLE